MVELAMHERTMELHITVMHAFELVGVLLNRSAPREWNAFMGESDSTDHTSRPDTSMPWISLDTCCVLNETLCEVDLNFTIWS